MTKERDTTRIVRSWLEDGSTAMPDRVLDAVLAELPSTPQRRSWWPLGRFPVMKPIIAIAGTAAVVLAVVLGAQLLGPATPTGVGGAPSAEPSAAPSPTSETSPLPTVWAGVPAGPFVVTGTDAPVGITLDIASSGWIAMPEFGAVSKNDDGLDAPEAVGAALLAWGWPAGTGINVYGDPCHWTTTIPDTPATTPDEIAAAFVAQALTDATAPVDVTVGGYAGKALTLHVPMSFDLPGRTRDAKFADCDNNNFAFYGVEGETGDARNAQGAGQIDELWILDVDGSIVILDAALSPATPADLVEETRTLAESATFE